MAMPQRDNYIKQTVFDVIQPDQGDSFCSRVFDRIITALILVGVA